MELHRRVLPFFISFLRRPSISLSFLSLSFFFFLSPSRQKSEKSRARQRLLFPQPEILVLAERN